MGKNYKVAQCNTRCYPVLKGGAEMSTTLTIRIDDKTKQKLERLASATARSKSYLVSPQSKNLLRLTNGRYRR